MANYYDSNKATSANSKAFILDGSEQQHFPFEGLYIGALHGGASELPALIDICEVKAFCFLYNDENTRGRVNHCLEKLAWRIAVTVPSNLCDIVLYNGGNPGDSFNTHSRLNKYIVGSRDEHVFFDGNTDTFASLVNEAYTSIVQRMSAINCAGKQSLVELNESLGNDAKLKYQFFILNDFPRHLKTETLKKLSQIVETGSRAGIYVLMSWDMNADFEDDPSFDPQSLLKKMALLFPKDGSYYFCNSGHDDILNRFTLELDDSAIAPAEATIWAEYVSKVVEIAKKNTRPTALKQDFAKLEVTPYEPVTSEISVTVGLDVNDKHTVTIRFNSGDYIHAFILGQSGSGKSVLLNNIITSAILKYSPEDLMLYLMDFKGVEFNRYRGIKHTKAVLVDNNDPQMTLEVLRELREENKQRVKLWQKEAVNNIDSYNKKHPDHRLPQILFVADECQVMFKSTNAGTERLIQQEISEILNIIATQGRSQGIHMLLATQQLDETDISGQILKNLTECFLLMSAPSDSDRLVPDSSNMTSRQMTGLACYYHKKELQSQVQTFYANDEELEMAISAAREKCSDLSNNGGHYFCGSALFYLEQDKWLVASLPWKCPAALIGRNIGINAGTTTIPLRKDFYEHILVWGANKEEQATGVLMNALLSLTMSCQQQGIYCNFVVIDCLPITNSRYKPILSQLQQKGLCQLVERQDSGSVFKSLVNDVKAGAATPTVLAIIGNERFIEMRRKMPLMTMAVQNALEEYDDDNIIGFDMEALGDLMNDGDESSTDNMTFPQALMYLLNEGAMHHVHLLMQVDKPCNILFGDDYDVEAATKFRHKVILRSENKYLNPFHFSQDIDVEALSDEEEHLRAFYYPDGDDPVLFTPYQMPQNGEI